MDKCAVEIENLQNVFVDHTIFGYNLCLVGLDLKINGQVRRG
jgi:hypothetical protein